MNKLENFCIGLLKVLSFALVAVMASLIIYLIYHDITTPHCVEYKAVPGNIVCVKFQ